MLAPVPPDHPFSGITVRLQRANENIVNLQSEIRRFFQECKYPMIPDPSDEQWQGAVDYHRSLSIPKRFSVLAGEIFHHWRSCLDHIVWIYSDPAYRKSHESAIQFPILAEAPNAEAMKRLERQIGGIAHPGKIHDLILEFQPYNLGIEAINSPLHIIHNMDRFDKHRELVIVESIGNLLLPPDTPPEVIAAVMAYTEDKPISSGEHKAIFRALNEQGKVLPEVAFTEFGKWKNQPVIPSLQKLNDALEKIIAAFLVAGNSLTFH